MNRITLVALLIAGLPFTAWAVPNHFKPGFGTTSNASTATNLLDGTQTAIPRTRQPIGESPLRVALPAVQKR